MAGGLDPTEEYDGSITVRLLDDSTGTEEIRCSSYHDAITVVNDLQYAVTAAKIIDHDGDVVLTSADINIDDRETHAHERSEWGRLQVGQIRADPLRF